METLIAEVLIIFLLVAANGVFAGAEIAVVSLRRTRIEQLVEDGHGGARAVKALRDEPERFLATVQVGITVVSATAAAYGGASLANGIVPLIARVPALAHDADEIAFALVVVSYSYLSIVLGELVPKSLALRAAERYSMLIGPPLRAMSFLARPVVWFLTASSNVLLRPFGDRTTFTEARHSADELQQLVEEASSAGTVNPRIGEIAARAFDFQEVTVREVMIPRQSVVMIPRGAAREEIRKILLEHTHTRFPVYDESKDAVVGYVSVKDLLALAWEERLFVLEDVIRPPWFIPESKRAVDLLEEMRARHLPFAIVVDELGTTAGIVTLEDLLEELVGEIVSEHQVETSPLVTPEGDRTFLVAGNTPIRDANRAIGWELPDEGDWTTVAGLAIAYAGHIPQRGELVRLPDGTQLEIVDASPRRVRSIRVRLPAKSPGG